MPIPTSFADLSTTVASNSPSGSDNVFPDLDNYLRFINAALASIQANSGNGWTSPYVVGSFASPTAIGSGTASTGRFTTLQSTGLTTAASLSVTTTSTFTGVATFTGIPTGAGLVSRFSAPGPIGDVTQSTGQFTTCTATTFSGSGAGLTSVPAGQLTGDVPKAQMATNLNASGSAPFYVARAWVNFNGTTNTNLSGTYSQLGTTTVTVTATAHGLSVGNTINADITSGTGVDGIYTVASVIDANNFTYTAGTSPSTSGAITLIRSTIRASGNVSGITDNGTGDYTVNFTTPMQDADYSAAASMAYLSGSQIRSIAGNGSYSQTASALRVQTWSNTTAIDADFVNVVIFR